MLRVARPLRRAALSSSAEAARTRPSQPRPPAVQLPKQLLRDAQSGSRLTLDEALYLAKEAGIWTREEVQLQIVRSPPFSPRERPFLLENFFEVADQGQDRAGDDLDEALDDEGGEVMPTAQEAAADQVIHGAIQRYFRPGEPGRFLHNEEEWLARAEGRGTRKRASAHAVIMRGTGLFKVNGESDMFAWWPMLYQRFDVCQPFKLTGTAGIYDVFVQVQGGGPTGQSGAARLAVARALLMANPNCHDNLQSGFCLLEDTRQKMSKMPGKKGARAGFPWTKR